MTGASRGIGRMLAVALAEDGAAVAGFARASDELASLAAELVVPFATDVTDPTAVERSFAAAAERLGPPTLLVTCAGSADALGPVSAVDPQRWWRAVETDLRGTMLCARAALTWMVPAARGRIVTIYGNLGDRGDEYVSAFAVAKAGVARLTETLAAELDGTGVLAVCVHPGFVRTPMTERLASGEEGRRWLPEFGRHAPERWGDGRLAVNIVRLIVAGAADRLGGRVIHASDDLGALTELAVDHDARRLRIRPTA